MPGGFLARVPVARGARHDAGKGHGSDKHHITWFSAPGNGDVHRWGGFARAARKILVNLAIIPPTTSRDFTDSARGHRCLGRGAHGVVRDRGSTKTAPQ